VLQELRRRVLGYLAGVSSAGIAALTQGNAVPQRLCTSVCASCGACTLAALPLLALLFKKSEGKARIVLLALALVLLLAGVYKGLDVILG